MQLCFMKYHHLGNDFILVDDRAQTFPINNPSFIQKLCKRHTGIGADGLILLQNSPKADFAMRIFNSDGNEAESCGNGIACLGSYLQEKNLGYSNTKIALKNTFVRVLCKDEGVQVFLSPPKDIFLNKKIFVENTFLHYHHVNTGVPHVVFFMDNIHNQSLDELGPLVRYNPIFKPEGVNVNLAQICDEKNIDVRTYERGVEKETLACGTGATAVALIASIVYNLPSPINIRHPGGKVTIHCQQTKKDITDVSMMTKPQKTFYGQMTYNMEN